MIDFGIIITYTIICTGLLVGAEIIIELDKMSKRHKSKAKVIRK